MSELTQYQLFKNTVAHKYSSQFLFYCRFTPPMERKLREELKLGSDVNLNEYFNMYDPVDISLDDNQYFRAENYEAYYRDIDKPAGSSINEIGVLDVPGSMHHFTRSVSPLRNASTFEDIKNYPYPFTRMIEVYKKEVEKMKAKADYAHKNGRVATCWIGQMYEDAWAIRGYEQFLEDMILNKEWCEYILDRFKEFFIVKAEAAVKAGADIIRTGDDVANQRAMMFSPKQWREMMKTRWAEVFEKARSINPDIQIWYHSDGNIEEIIPDLIEIGITVLNPLQPECMDIVGIKKKYGRRLCLAGCWDSSGPASWTTTSDEVLKDELAKYVDTFAPGGGFMYTAYVMGALGDEVAKRKKEIIQNFYEDYARDWYMRNGYN